MSDIVSDAFKNAKEPEWLAELRSKLNSVDDIEKELIQRYGFTGDGAINVIEQLFIFECIDAVKRLAVKPL